MSDRYLIKSACFGRTTKCVPPAPTPRKLEQPHLLITQIYSMFNIGSEWYIIRSASSG